MKPYIKYIVIGLGLFTSVSCKKTMEKEPLERLNEDLVFDQIDKNADYAKQFLWSIYTILPNGYNRVGNAFLCSGTDDALFSQDGNPIESFRNGRISANNVIDNQWSQNYQGIRKANVFLSKIDRVPTTADNIQYWKAEARFLRAMFYFELIKRWGGVPLMGDQVLGINDNLQLKRNTLDECVNYVTSECDAISGLLRPGPIPVGEIGRITKGAALALKSRMLLYAASPLYNTNGDMQRWTAALQAANDVITFGQYSLATDYTGLFVTASQAEIILARINGTNTSIESLNGPVGFATQGVGQGLTSPSQDLVDAFPMKSGIPITAANSLYDPNNPYNNRDPRLDATVIYNGKKWLGRPIETFEGGLDKPGGVTVQTKTGYYLRKFMGKFESSSSYSTQPHNFIIFRYAETLLNYAEARNEVDGPVKEVYDALIKIRARAGITAGADGKYGIAVTSDKNVMRSIIQNERRIEFAFEEHRFWDIRRWKIAGDVMNKPVRGMRIDKQANNVLTYTVFNAATSIFDVTKMYWFPIPYTEIETNKNMQQNPGWSF